MNTAAVILAAGAGTRMKSKKPKVAHEMMGKPLVRWVIDAAEQAGVARVVTVVGHMREQVEPLVADKSEIVVQEHQRGTADAVASCREALGDFDGSLLVLSGDCPLITADTMRALADMRESNDAAVVVLTMRPENPFGYGRIIRDEAGAVERIVEQKDATEEEKAIRNVNSGAYWFRREDLIASLGKLTTDNAAHEYYLTDTIYILKQEGKNAGVFVTENADVVLGANDREQLQALNDIAARNFPEAVK